MNQIVTIDGPGGAGKGTISRIIAMRQGWHYLDSGALYRALALLSARAGVSDADHAGLVTLAANMPLTFLLQSESEDHRVLLADEDVTDQLRSETVGNLASKIAAVQVVREALLAWQRNYAKPPGLIADGRDMGTVVFPSASHKIYLTASLDERAARRYKQLIEKGLNVSLGDLLEEIQARDARDMNRAVAPLRPAEDAISIDSTQDSIAQVVDKILKIIKA